MEDTIDLNNLQFDCKINKTKNTIKMSIPEFMKLYKTTDIYKQSEEYKNKIKLGRNFDTKYYGYKDIKDIHVEEYSA